MRRAGWSPALLDVLDKHREAPFAWGRSDCFVLMMDVVEAITGERLYPELVGAYETERRAAEILLDRGARSVEDLVAAVLPRIPVFEVRSGDLCCADGAAGIAGAVVVGLNVFGKSPAGLTHHPLDGTFHYYAVR